MRPFVPRPIRVLLVERDPGDLDAVQKAMTAARGGEVQIDWAGDLAGALARLSKGGFDAVLLDLHLDDSRGAATFEQAHAFAPEVPMIVLGGDDEAEAMATVQGGAQDYLVRDDVSPSMVVKAVGYAIERHRLFTALRSLSLIDDLTGLYNRQGFSDLGGQYLKLAVRQSRSVALVQVDVDRLKTINDALGHHVGDRALLGLANLLKATFRSSDVLARTGGGEYTVLAAEASSEGVEVVVKRLRERVGLYNEVSREPYRLSVSIGTARLAPGEETALEDLCRRAGDSVKREKRTKREAVTG